MSSTMIDAIIIVVLILSTVFAWSRGLVREALSLLGWVIAIFVAGTFAYTLVPLVESIPFIKDVVDTCELNTVIAFVLLFIIMMVVMALITPFFSDMVKNSRVGLINSALGGFFGFLRGILIVLMIFIVYDTFIATSMAYKGMDESRTYNMFKGPRANIEDALPTQEEVPDFLSKQFNNVTKHCRSDATNE